MKLIKINTGHYIIVDDSEIKEGDWYVHNQRGVGLRVQRCVGTNLPMDSKKITHSTQPIEQYYGATDGTIPFVYHKIIELPLSEVKELIGEVDVEKKAREIVINNNPFGSENFSVSTFNGLVKDITKALEDNKDKKYTEEDLRKIIEWLNKNYSRVEDELARPYQDKGEDLYDGFFKDVYEEALKRAINFIQPKTEWEVEIIDGKLKLK